MKNSVKLKDNEQIGVASWRLGWLGFDKSMLSPRLFSKNFEAQTAGWGLGARFGVRVRGLGARIR